MGLDSVELLMAFEETFDIAIPDEAAERIATVRDAIDYIYAHVPHADGELRQICRTQRAFHRLRRTLRDELHVERAAVRPDTRWETLIPIERRCEVWDRLKSVVATAHWPHLARSPETKALIVSLVVAAAAFSYAVAPSFKPAAASLAAAASSWAALRATEGWRTSFTGHATVGQTAELLALELPPAWHTAQADWTREQVRQTVRQLIVAQMNIDPGFDDDARFVDDLGVD